MTLFDRADANMRHASTLWGTMSGGSVEERNGLLRIACPAPLRSFNQVLVLDPNVSADALRAAAEAYGGARFRSRVVAAWDERLARTFEAAGLVHNFGIPSLVLSQEIDTVPPDADLTIARVGDEQTLADHCAVVAAGFGWEAGHADLVFTPALVAHGDFAAWVAYADGVPVASCQLVSHEETAGLYYIATVEAARRRGYAETITRHAIAEGRSRGCDITSLQASSMGRPVYERIGFEVVGEYVTYIPRNSDK